MSSGIMPYLVPQTALLARCGSGDLAFAAEVIEAHRERIEHLDESYVDRRDDEDETPPLLTAEAIVEIIQGAPSRPDLGHVYGYAFELICRHLGPLMCNSHASGRSSWIDCINAHLARLGLGLSLTELAFGGPPIPLPMPDDYPFIGHWTASAVAAAADAFQGLDIDDDSDEASALLEIRGWLVAARAEPGAMIVGFCY